MRIILNIDAEPVAKGRARSTKGGIHYTPKKTRDYEAMIRAEAIKSSAEPLQGPLCLMATFHFAMPKSWSKKKQTEVMADGGIDKTSKPDLDNLVKAVQDGLNGVLWGDDAQIVEIHAKKRYGERSHIQVAVMPSAVDYVGVCS